MTVAASFALVSALLVTVGPRDQGVWLEASEPTTDQTAVVGACNASDFAVVSLLGTMVPVSTASYGTSELSRDPRVPWEVELDPALASASCQTLPLTVLRPVALRSAASSVHLQLLDYGFGRVQVEGLARLAASLQVVDQQVALDHGRGLLADVGRRETTVWSLGQLCAGDRVAGEFSARLQCLYALILLSADGVAMPELQLRSTAELQAVLDILRVTRATTEPREAPLAHALPSWWSRISLWLEHIRAGSTCR